MKLRLSNKISCLLILMSWVTIPAFAQRQFKFKASVQKVDSNGFYSIQLQPNLTGKCRPNLADIRMLDEQGKQVPYLMGNSLPVKVKTSYRELPQLAVAASKDSLTSYIVKNQQGLSVSQIWLKLRNTAVNRSINVLGSEDLQQWFAIKEDIRLQGAAKSTSGAFEELIILPTSTYSYFKIEVNGKNRAPINILQAGVYINQTAKPAYIPVPQASLISKHKADTSLFTISFNEPYRVDRLHLQITGIKYYRRRVQVYALTGKKKEWLKDTVISSAGNGYIYASARASKLLLIVLNEDNPPLAVQSVQTYQLKQSLVAYLDKRHQYQIWVGNKNANAPQYDLQFFTDSIVVGELPVISHGAIIPVLYAQKIQQKGGLSVWLIWVAGALALLILLMLTLKMTKEVSKNNTSKE